MRVAILLVALLCLFVPGLPSSAAPSGTTVTLTNFTPNGDQAARVDVNGNALDAHDGQITQVGNTYYLYGTSYTCGYEYPINSNFRGFKVYSSTDLTHWTDRGYVPLPRSCQYCFRPARTVQCGGSCDVRTRQHLLPHHVRPAGGYPAFVELSGGQPTAVR